MGMLFDARTATDHFPGIGRYVTNLAQALTTLHPPLAWQLLRAPHPSPRLPLPNWPGPVTDISPFALAQQWRIPALLRQHHVQVYHSNYYVMPYAPGVPTTLTVYDTIALNQPAEHPPRQRALFWLAHALAVHRAQHLFAISQATALDVQRWFGVPAHKITVTPLAANRHFTPQPRPAIEAVRARYGLSTHYVLYVGSNKPHKNLPRLVQAFGLSRLSRTGWTLVMAGHWDARYPQAQALAARLNLPVRFVPNVPEADLPALYSGAGVFVFPSLYEGFGLPVLEAMACGAPVTCACTASLPEVAGEAARLFNPLDPADMAHALDLTAAEPETRRAHSLARAALFDWERTAQLTAQRWRTMLDA